MGCTLVFLGRGTLVLKGQADDEGGSFAGLALEPDFPLVLLDHDIVCQRQPLSGAFADRLGGEERLENA